jgi:hypothetical protein
VNVKLSVKKPASGRHNKSCPICEGKKDIKPPFEKYHTKHGELKNERVLAQNLKKKGLITEDDKVGTVFPFEGGDNDHQGWKVKKDVLEDVEVTVRPTPHHLIPGNAAMAQSDLEQWTRAKHGKIVEDIGYNVDCTRNGLWMPHLPHVYWTSYRTKTKRWCDKYGKWSKLDPDEQDFVGQVVMGETNWQMHYTDHDDPYADMPHDTTYDGNALDRCQLLAELMEDFWSIKCEEGEDALSGKLVPPYGLVERINLQSDYMLQRMTGPPGKWKEFVSPLAQRLNKAVKDKKVKIKKKNVVWLA